MNVVLDISKESQESLDILNSNGYEAYVVGGCVRDSLIGIEPKDWDITTSAKPDEILRCFKNYKTIKTGLKHGTVTVIVDSVPVEITTYRIDGEYKDNRRPQSVSFTQKLSLDLERRDFTINAIAYGKDGIIDIHGGLKDIRSKQIKCVGNPDSRFSEDGLRILRALRFASVLNFKIESTTSKSIHKNRHLLKNISAERIMMEFNKLITGENFHEIMLEYKDVIEIFIPETEKIQEKNWINLLNVMIFVEPEVDLRLAVLLKEIVSVDTRADNEKFSEYEDSIKYKYIDNLLRRLKYDTNTINSVEKLSLNIDAFIEPITYNIKLWLNKLGEERLRKLLKIKKAVLKSKKDYCGIDKINYLYDMIDDIVFSGQCYNLKQLAVNGNDIINLGISSGIQVGEILNYLLKKVMAGELKNKKDILLNCAAEKLNK